MEEFNINRIKLLLLTFLVLTLSSGIGAAKEISVNPGDSIQAAINSASSGDSIIVYPGTYTENIDVNRSVSEFKSASGNPDDTIIASNNVGKDVISVKTRSNLKITGFTIKGAGTGRSGISLDTCSGCTIENNKFLNNGVGVSIKSSPNCTVRNNTASRTSDIGTGRGIYIQQSYPTTISSNTISNQQYGIYITGSQSNTISGNTVSHSSSNGIELDGASSNNVLESNTVSSNGQKGIYLVANSNKNNVKNNTVSSNGGNGIDMELSSENTVLNNTVEGNITTDSNNNHGIFLNNCTYCYVQSNTVSNCEYGFAMRYSNNNNVINNNAYDNDRGFFVAYTSSKNTLSGNKASLNKLNGIVLFRSGKDNIVDSNEANSNANYGIYLETVDNNKISNNEASNNNKRGIVLLGSGPTNTLSSNTLNSNGDNGIRLENSNGNTIINNIESSSSSYGICLVGSSSNNKLESNTVQHNNRGIYVETSTGNTLSQNIAYENTGSGIMLSQSNNNTLLRNIIAPNNIEGITVNSSENNTISGNNISLDGNGIYLCPKSINNLIYNNYFNNTNNANVKNNKCYWNIEKTSGRNVMGGPNLGGNFWGTLSSLGFSETNPDDNEDGIIDKTFVTNDGIQEPRDGNGSIIDYYPLKRVPLPVVDFNADTTKGFAPLTVQFTDRSQDATSWSWDFGDGSSLSPMQNPTHTFSGVGTYTVTLTAGNKYGTADPKAMQITVQKFTILPVADFSASVTSGNAPLNVQFTDLSQNATSWSWNFGDGSPVSTYKSPMHIYSTAGTYTASLTANNENGTSPIPKTVIIAVTQESSSSGGSSGGSSSGGSSSGGSSGGGSAGSSPEPAKNVEVKEISQAFITNGKPVNFDFAREATCVVYVNFDAKKTAGKTNAIAEQLKGKSTLVSDLNAGEVYKYFNVWVGTGGFATSKNIENPVVCFKVDKSWLQDKNIDQASITLSRCSDKTWSQLPTKLLKEDDRYLYFTAETPEFSFFAITGKAGEKETVTEIKPETDTSKSEQNDVKSEVEKEQKTEQNTSQGKTTSIPGFETIYFVACLLTVFLYKRK